MRDFLHNIALLVLLFLLVITIAVLGAVVPALLVFILLNIGYKIAGGVSPIHFWMVYATLSVVLSFIIFRGMKLVGQGFNINLFSYGKRNKH